jgi:D-glycero-D-manno-heptose 1,7-bisphosphate phosphatase
LTARRAVFLDRDGTLVRDTGYLKDADELELLPGTAAALRALREDNFELYVATNQSGVGRGLYDETDVEAVNLRLTELLAERGVHVDGVYVCPHEPDAGCECRKPRPGLLLQAGRDHCIDFDQSVMVGNRQSDVEAGHAAGCRSVLLSDITPPGSTADAVVPDLLAASHWIRRQR